MFPVPSFIQAWLDSWTVFPFCVLSGFSVLLAHCIINMLEDRGWDHNSKHFKIIENLYSEDANFIHQAKDQQKVQLKLLT